MEVRVILELLRAEGSIVVNKKLAHIIGLNEAVLYSELVSKYLYYIENDSLDGEGYFYSTLEDIEKSTTLSRYQQDRAIKKLIKLGLVEYKVKGVPAKRYFRILENENIYKLLENLFVRNSQTGLSETNKQDCEKLTNYYNNTNINNTNINNTNNNIYRGEISKIIQYLNTKANTNYRTRTPTYQRLIRARLKEGFTYEDFKKVIDKKVEEWSNTDMEKYIRPQTLFGTKFDYYLNQKLKPRIKNLDDKINLDEYDWSVEEGQNGGKRKSITGMF